MILILINHIPLIEKSTIRRQQSLLLLPRFRGKRKIRDVLNERHFCFKVKSFNIVKQIQWKAFYFFFFSDTYHLKFGSFFLCSSNHAFLSLKDIIYGPGFLSGTSSNPVSSQPQMGHISDDRESLKVYSPHTGHLCGSGSPIKSR